MKKYIKVSEAARELGVTEQTIRLWDKQGKINTIRTVGNHRRIEKEEIERLKEGRR